MTLTIKTLIKLNSVAEMLPTSCYRHNGKMFIFRFHILTSNSLIILLTHTLVKLTAITVLQMLPTRMQLLLSSTI